MTKNDEKFRSKAVALDFFPPLHPVILVSFHHKNGHPYTIPSLSCHPVIQRSQKMGARNDEMTLDEISKGSVKSGPPPPSAEGGGVPDF